MKPNTSNADIALMSVCNQIKIQVQSVDRGIERIDSVIVLLAYLRAREALMEALRRGHRARCPRSLILRC